MKEFDIISRRPATVRRCPFQGLLKQETSYLTIKITAIVKALLPTILKFPLKSTLYHSDFGLYHPIITSFKSRLGKDLTRIHL